MKTYSELYFFKYNSLYVFIKTDILILTNIFEQFRDVTMENFGLDPCHYYTTPGMSWDALFKLSAVKMELIIDQDMLMFFETSNSK